MQPTSARRRRGCPTRAVSTQRGRAVMAIKASGTGSGALSAFPASAGAQELTWSLLFQARSLGQACQTLTQAKDTRQAARGREFDMLGLGVPDSSAPNSLIFAVGVKKEKSRSQAGRALLLSVCDLTPPGAREAKNTKENIRQKTPPGTPTFPTQAKVHK